MNALLSEDACPSEWAEEEAASWTLSLDDIKAANAMAVVWEIE